MRTLSINRTIFDALITAICRNCALRLTIFPLTRSHDTSFTISYHEVNISVIYFGNDDNVNINDLIDLIVYFNKT